MAYAHWRSSPCDHDEASAPQAKCARSCTHADASVADASMTMDPKLFTDVAHVLGAVVAGVPPPPACQHVRHWPKFIGAKKIKKFLGDMPQKWRCALEEESAGMHDILLSGSGGDGSRSQSVFLEWLRTRGCSASAVPLLDLFKDALTITFRCLSKGHPFVFVEVLFMRVWFMVWFPFHVFC